MRALVIICLVATFISAGLSGYLVYRLDVVERQLTAAVVVSSADDYTSRFDDLDAAVSAVSDSASQAAGDASDATSKVDSLCLQLRTVC